MAEVEVFPDVRALIGAAAERIVASAAEATAALGTFIVRGRAP
jgi:hypothetical protein